MTRFRLLASLSILFAALFGSYCWVSGIEEPAAQAQPFAQPAYLKTNAGPLFTSVEAVSTIGGTLNIGVSSVIGATGSDAGIPAIWVQTGGTVGTGGLCGYGAGSWTQLTGVSFVSSTNLLATLPAGTYTAGNYNIALFQSDGQVACGGALFVITATQTPPQILSGCSGSMWVASGYTLNTDGGIATVPDTFGGTAYPLNVPVGGGGSVNTSDPSFSMPNIVSIGENGTSQAMCTAQSIAWAASTQTVMIDGAFYFPSGVASLSGFGEYETALGNFFALAHGGNTQQVYASMNGAGTALGIGQSLTPNTWVGWDTFLSSISSDAGISANNQPIVSAGSTSVIAATVGRFCVGGEWGGGTPTAFAAMNWAFMLAANCTPTPTQVRNLVISNWATYGVTAPPTFIGMTEVPSMTNAPARVSGTGFMSGISFSAACTGSDGGITSYAATTNSVGSYGTTTYADITFPLALPIGTCDLTFSNLDGRSRTQNDAVNVKAPSADPFVCAMACFGTTVVGLYAQPSTTCTVNTTTSPCTGSNVCCSSWLDQSGLANNESNATASEMMVLKSADGTFGSTYSYLKGNGSSDCLFTGNSANVHYDTSGTPSPYMSIVTQVPASNSGSAGSFGESSDNIQIGKFASSDPSTVYTGGTASWGSTVSGVRNVMSGATANPDGGPPTLSISDSNGTPVTAMSTGVHPVTTAAWFVGSDVNAAFFYSGPVAAEVVLNAPPTQTDAGAATGTGCWESCAQSLLGANQIAANDNGLAQVPPVGGLSALGALGALALLRRRRADQEAA